MVCGKSEIREKLAKYLAEGPAAAKRATKGRNCFAKSDVGELGNAAEIGPNRGNLPTIKAHFGNPAESQDSPLKFEIREKLAKYVAEGTTGENEQLNGEAASAKLISASSEMRPVAGQIAVTWRR